MAKENLFDIKHVEQLTHEEEDSILAEYNRRFGGAFSFESLEDLLTSPDGFGLETATDLQRACCRVIQGLPLGRLAKSPAVRRALGEVDLPEMDKPPSDVIILAAIRTAKSMMAAATAIWAARNCDMSILSSGEIPRFSILSLQLDNARVVHAHLLGALQKPKLAAIRVTKSDQHKWKDLIDDTGADVIGSEFLWHPSGRPVEIRVVAGKRAGGSVVSRWSAGCVYDEAPRMVGSADAVVNYEDSWRAVRGRLLPGAQILSIGSPWQPWGPIYDRVINEWGRPTKNRVVIKATGPAMNPYWWTPERCEEIRNEDPTVFKTDVLAEFADAQEQLFTQELLVKSSRDHSEPIPHEPGHDYTAAMDPATRGNAWTLTIGDRKGRTKREVFHKEWRGTSLEPLSPREVLTEAAAILYSYGLDWCYTDQYSADANRDIAKEVADEDGEPTPIDLIIEEWNQREKIDAYQCLAIGMADGTVEISDDPQLHKDLKMVKKVPTQKGVTIHLPTTPDGRHCDYAPPMARMFKRWIEEDSTIAPLAGEKGYWEYYEAQMIAREEEEFNRTDSLWWENDPYAGV